MSGTEPYITVLMPAYNAETYIGEAIESILNQTFGNFEFIIVDDGSEDSTADIIDFYRSEDERIRPLKNESNKGLCFSLNRGLDAASGKYIARMDADDISLPERFEKQVSFMDSHHEVAVSSAWMKTIGKRKADVWTTPTSHNDILAQLFCNNCLWHPVAVIRREVLEFYDIRYDSRYPKAEDYKLWIDIAKHKKLANIPEILHRYRIHQSQKTKLDNTFENQGKAYLHYLKHLPGIRIELLTNFLSRDVTLDEVELHQKLFFEIPFAEEKQLDNIQEWIDFLISVNREKKKYAEPVFSNALRNSFLHAKKKSFKRYCNQHKRFTPKLLIKLFFSRSNYYLNFSLFQLTLLTINCFMFRINKNFSVEYLKVES